MNIFLVILAGFMTFWSMNLVSSSYVMSDARTAMQQRGLAFFLLVGVMLILKL